MVIGKLRYSDGNLSDYESLLFKDFVNMSREFSKGDIEIYNKTISLQLFLLKIDPEDFSKHLSLILYDLKHNGMNLDVKKIRKFVQMNTDGFFNNAKRYSKGEENNPDRFLPYFYDDFMNLCISLLKSDQEKQNDKKIVNSEKIDKESSKGISNNIKSKIIGGIAFVFTWLIGCILLSFIGIKGYFPMLIIFGISIWAYKKTSSVFKQKDKYKVDEKSIKNIQNIKDLKSQTKNIFINTTNVPKNEEKGKKISGEIISEEEKQNNLNNIEPEEITSVLIDEKGNELWHSLSPDQAFEFLNDGQLSPEEVDAFIDANEKESVSSAEKLSNKPPKVGTNRIKYLQQKKEHEQKVKEANDIADFWRTLKDKNTTK